MTQATDDAISGNGTTDAAEGGDPPEAIHPEVVEPAEPRQDMAAAQGYSALERAADAALALPGLPGRDEFLALAMQARILAMSAGAPKAVRNNPHLAFHIAMIGRDLNISPSAALQLVDVIGYNDKATTYEAAYDKVQLSISPELLNGQVRRLGLGRIVKGQSGDQRCVAVALAPDGKLDPRCGRTLPDDHWRDPDDPGTRCDCVDVLGAVEFTWEDGRIAGLVGPTCMPGEHTEDCLKWVRGKSCNQGYKTYPKRMLWWRCAGWCQSDYFPEASIGLYSPEELGAIVDAEGRPIDPATIELPPGYEPKALPPPPPSEDLLVDAEPDSDLATSRRDLRARIDALGAVPDAQQALRDLWQLRDDEGQPKLPPFGHLRRRHLTMARAMVKGVEDRIKRAEWGDEAKVAWADASVAAAGFGAGTAQTPQEPEEGAADQTPAEAPGAPETATEPPETADPAPDAYDYGAAFDRSVACNCGQADALVEEHGMSCPVRLTYHQPAEVQVEPPAAAVAPTVDHVTTQVAMLSPAEVVAQLSELLPEGETMPRSKDGRHVRLVDLIMARLTEEHEPEQLGLDTTTPPAE